MSNYFAAISEISMKFLKKSSTYLKIYAYFISNTFISNARLKLAKIQAKAKQHPEAELLVFENYSLFHLGYHPKIMGDVLKNVLKTSVSVLIRLFD